MGKQDVTEDRRQRIGYTIRANKEVEQLPKNSDWQHDGEYCSELAEHVMAICEKYGMIPTMNHMASALGVTKGVVDDVRLGYIPVNPDVKGVIDAYYGLCESVMVQSTLDGTSNNAAGIFMNKALYGFKEEPREVIVSHNKVIGNRTDPAQIAERYASAVIEAEGEF